MRAEAQRIRQGVLLIEIKGPQPERLLNLAVQNGVDLRRVHRLDRGRLQAQVSPGEFRQLRDLARPAGCTLHIRRRRGLPFLLAGARRRPVLPLAALLFIPLLAFCCSIVSSVTVTSPYELDPAEQARVGELAAQAGLIPGRSCWRMDLEAAEQAILKGFPQIFYAEIFRRGNALEIKVVRRLDVPPGQEIRPPGDVVALAPGVIRHVLVERGTAQVSSGDTVRAGQVLISGGFAGEYLGASGLVTAFVFSEGYGECYEREIILEKTGRSHQQLGLALSGSGGRDWARLAGAGAGGYLLSQAETEVRPLSLWRKIDLPVELILVEVAELDPARHSRSPDQARDRARELSRERAGAALAAWGLELCEDPRLDSQSLDLGDGVQRVHTVATALAEIGGFQARSREELEEWYANPPPAPSDSNESGE